MLVFIFIIMASEMLRMTDLIVNQGVGPGELFSLFGCLLPNVILIALPVACLMAVLLSFIRMSSDNEIIALQSSGISLYQLMPSVVLFSVICFFFSIFITMFWNPYGNRTYKSISLNIVKSRAEIMVKERVFGALVKDVIFYVNSYSPKDKVMKDIFVVDKRNGREITFVARKGKFIHTKNGIVLRFMDGTMFTDERGGKSGISEFPGFMDYPLEIDSMLGSSGGNVKKPDEMYLSELLEFINLSPGDNKKENLAKLTLYEMFSIPVAVFIIGIIGAPLGAHIRSQGRTKGIIISLLIFLSYYAIHTTVNYLCENGSIMPALGVWLPVLFLLLVCIFLLFGASGTISYGFFDRLTYDS